MSEIGLKSKRNIRVLLFDFVCIVLTVALNVSASLVSSKFHFPFYMDSIATIALASICGFFPAVLGAFLTNLVITLFGKLRLIFCLCQILTASGACLVFYLFRRSFERSAGKSVGKFAKLCFFFGGGDDNFSNFIGAVQPIQPIKCDFEFSLDAFMLAGILSALSNGILGSVFAAFMGYNLTPIEKGLYFLTENIFFSNLAGGFILNLIDKTLSAFISYLIYLFANRFIFRADTFGFGFAGHHFFETCFQKNSFNDDAEKRINMAFFLKPEYIFLLIAGFTLISGILLKNQIGKTFSEEYEERASSFFSENDGGDFKTLREFELSVNESFDAIIFSSFALIFISVAIIQYKYSRQKRLLELFREHEETQKSFSRDLHDTVAQSLSVLKIAVETGDKEKALYWVDKSILETRELISSLRLDLSEDFVSIVKNYAKSFELNFFIKTLVFEATKFAMNFDSRTKEELFRILQESLSNVAKHADATEIEIKMMDVANEFVMSIIDNGLGFDKNAKTAEILAQKMQTHIGLKSMKERAESIGAEFSVKSSSSGTSVLVKMKVR